MTTIEVQHWFSSPVWKTFIDIDTESLIEYIYKIKETDPGVSKSNYGGWQSSILPNPPLSHHDLIHKINEVISSVHQNFGLSTQLTTAIDHHWYNINHQYNYNSKHIHPDGVFSGVCYLQVPHGDCGDIIFHRENLVLNFLNRINMDAFNESNSTIARYKPSRLMLLVFPSWLEHEVLPNLTNQDRISFSFNASIN